jgi:hypothetical protein
MYKLKCSKTLSDIFSSIDDLREFILKIQRKKKLKN